MPPEEIVILDQLAGSQHDAAVLLGDQRNAALGAVRRRPKGATPGDFARRRHRVEPVGQPAQVQGGGAFRSRRRARQIEFLLEPAEHGENLGARMSFGFGQRRQPGGEQRDEFAPDGFAFENRQGAHAARLQKTASPSRFSVSQRARNAATASSAAPGGAGAKSTRGARQLQSSTGGARGSGGGSTGVGRCVRQSGVW